MALFGATGWIGGVIGFAFAEYALQTFGMVATLMVRGCLALGAVGLVVAVKAKARDDDRKG